MGLEIFPPIRSLSDGPIRGIGRCAKAKILAGISTGKAPNNKRLRAASELVSAAVLISIVVSVALLLSGWMASFIKDFNEQSSKGTGQKIACGNAAFDFNASFGNQGVSWDFSGIDDRLDVSLINTGLTDLYNFTIIAILDSDRPVPYTFSINESYQKTRARPLRPGTGTILKPMITADISGTLKEIEILTLACPDVKLKRIF